MFEQAVLSERLSTRRYWAAFFGLGSQLILIAGVLIAPLIWPQLLPRTNLLTWITVPLPPPMVPKTPEPAHVQPVSKPVPFTGGRFFQPTTVPNRIAVIDDLPTAPAGVVVGAATSELTGLALGVISQVIQAAPPARVADPPKPAQAKPAAATEPPRYKAGGLVKMARLLRRVEPLYPAIARQARISGTVELTGIIGTDGRIRELQVVTGHPLLVKAALDAVREWVYEPTSLNGTPVEVIAPITVNFRLN